MQGPGFDPWSGRIPQAMERVSPCSTATESVPQRLGAATTELPGCKHWSRWALVATLCHRRHCNKEPSRQRAAPARCNQRKACAAAKTQHSQKQINKIKICCPRFYFFLLPHQLWIPKPNLYLIKNIITHCKSTIGPIKILKIYHCRHRNYTEEKFQTAHLELTMK